MVKTKKLLPEEEVRQWFLGVLRDCGVEEYRTTTEYPVRFGTRRLRVDIVVFERGTTTIRLIVECKAPGVPISRDTFQQAATYNSVLGAQYVVATNGKKTYIFDAKNNKFLDSMPQSL